MQRGLKLRFLLYVAVIPGLNVVRPQGICETARSSCCIGQCCIADPSCVVKETMTSLDRASSSACSEMQACIGHTKRRMQKLLMIVSRCRSRCAKAYLSCRRCERFIPCRDEDKAASVGHGFQATHQVRTVETPHSADQHRQSSEYREDCRTDCHEQNAFTAFAYEHRLRRQLHWPATAVLLACGVA